MAADAERAAEVHVISLLREAREASAGWPEIGSAMGLTAEKARWRLRQADKTDPSLINRAAGAPTRSPVPVKSSDPSAPGLSVKDAATRLGISRVQVYRQIKSGKLTATQDSAGFVRVLIDPRTDQ